MISFRGKNYYSPLEANKKFKISLPTIYYWIRRGEFKDHILNLEKFGEEKDVDPKEFRAFFYIEEKILKEKARYLNYLPIEIHSKR